jgi:hypothetical protein
MHLPASCAAIAVVLACTRQPEAIELDPGEQLRSLTQSQTAALCNELGSEYPPKQVTCGDAIVTVGETVAACRVGLGVLAPSCSATIADEQACLAQVYAAPCDDQAADDACDEVVDCQGSDD